MTETPEATPENTQKMLAEFIDAATAADIPMPKRFVGQLAAEIKKLLDEGITAAAIRAGFARMAERRIIQPSLLGNFVVEAALPRRAPPALRYGRGMTTQQILDHGKGLE